MIVYQETEQPSFTVVTRPFALDGKGGTVRGLHQSASNFRPPRGTVVVAPAFGTLMRKGQSVALYFLLNGFDVVRYDPTNHVGVSDGEMPDLTPTSLVEDLSSVLTWAGDFPDLFLYATSISARLGVLSLQRGASVRGMGMISAVVDMHSSIAIADGDDHVGAWLSGAVTDPQELRRVLEHPVKFTFVEDLVRNDWHTLESGRRDYLAVGDVPMAVVMGAKDTWVDEREVDQLIGSLPRGEVTIIDDSGHHLNPASGRVALSVLVSYFASLSSGPALSGSPIGPRIPHIIQLSKNEVLLNPASPTKDQVEVTLEPPFDLVPSPTATNSSLVGG
jgi:Acyl transferase